MKLLIKYRLFKYLLLLTIVVVAINMFKTKWPIKNIDHTIYKWFYFNDSENVLMNPLITVIDLPYLGEQQDSIIKFRNQLGKLLDNIYSNIKEENQPEAIFLDYYFENTMTQGIDVVRKAIEQFNNSQTKKTKIYAIFNVLNHRKIKFEDQKERMDEILYSDSIPILEANGLTHSLIYHASGVISFDSYLKYEKRSGGSKPIILLPLKVKNDIANIKDFKVFLKKPENFILPIGNKESLYKRTYQFHEKRYSTFIDKCEGTSDESYFLKLSDSCYLSPLNTLNEKFVIIGSLEADKEDFLEDSGPNLLAWALNDQLYQNENHKSRAKLPFDSFAGILGMVIFFSCLVVFIYSWIFNSKIKMQSSPFLIGGISVFIGFIFLILTGLGILTIEDKVLPVGFILSSMFVAVILTWSYHKKYIERGDAHGNEKYDIFISVSGGQEKWIRKNLIDPLKKIKNPDKSQKYNIFFYKESIKLGANYVDVYKNAITNSKIFVPLMTEDYFDSPYCSKEMIFADGQAEKDLLQILPITFNLEEVKPIYKDKNIEVIDEDFELVFIPKLIKRLKEMRLQS